jgi:hypothetical protein
VSAAAAPAGAAVAHAELVAFRVGHDHPVRAVLAPDSGLEAPRSERFEPGDLGFEVRRVDVEVILFSAVLGSGTACRSSFGFTPSASTSMT